MEFFITSYLCFRLLTLLRYGLKPTFCRWLADLLTILLRFDIGIMMINKNIITVLIIIHHCSRVSKSLMIHMISSLFFMTITLKTSIQN